MPPKKNRDPNKPKGRMSPYAFFVQERRAQYRQKGQEVKFTEFSKECADLWRGMNEDQKKKYVKYADADRERYRSEMAQYKPPAGRGSKKKKDPNMPKRAVSGFFFFCGEKRPKLKEQNPQATVGEIAKQLGAAWKIMTPEQKAPYEQQSKDDRKRYEREMEQYRKGKFTHASPEDDDDDDDDEDESD